MRCFNDFGSGSVSMEFKPVSRSLNMCHLCVLFVLLDKRRGGSDSEGISTQLPFMLGLVSFGSGTSWWCCGVWAGVELSVVSSTGVKWCNSV